MYPNEEEVTHDDMGQLAGFGLCCMVFILSAAFWGAVIYGCCAWARGG